MNSAAFQGENPRRSRDQGVNMSAGQRVNGAEILGEAGITTAPRSRFSAPGPRRANRRAK